MVGAPAQGTKRVCPECGHAIEGTRPLYRTRRHWRTVFLGLTCVLSGLALGTIAMAGGKPWQRFVPASILILLVNPDDVGSGVIDATWDELRTRAKYDQLSAWQRRALVEGIAGTLDDRDTASRLAALEAIQDLNPPRSAVLAGVLTEMLRRGPTPPPPSPSPLMKIPVGGTGTLISDGPWPVHIRHDRLVVRLLGRVGASADAPLLETVLRGRQWSSERREAMWALAALNDPDVVAILCGPMIGTLWDEGLVAVALLGDRGGTRAEQFISDARAESDPRYHPFVDACADAVNGTSAHVSIALSEMLGLDVGIRPRSMAFQVLRRLGPDAAPAVPTLIGLLDSEAPGTRRTAAALLGAIGPKAAAALPRLRQLAEGPEVVKSASLERAARVAIDQIRRPD